MFRWLQISVILLCIGCNQPNQQQQQPAPSIPYSFDLDSVKQRGKLVALVDNSNTSYFLYKGQAMGFEYEMLKRFADHLEVDLEVKVINNLDSMMTYLNRGVGDIVAANITVTSARKKKVAFSHSILKTRQVLIQRNDRDSLITSLEQLSGKCIHVWTGSAFMERLKNLSGEIGEPLNIIAVRDSDTSMELNKTLQLIKQVSMGDIDYTVADENVAKVQKKIYQNLNIKLPISLEQNIAWAFRLSDTLLLQSVNEWIQEEKRKNDYYTIYTKYFKARTVLKKKLTSDFSSVGGGKISIYDEDIKANAKRIGWDWRLLAAQIFQESKFDPNSKSWTGASGLMQLIPHTAQAYNLDSLSVDSPTANLYAGVSYLIWIDKYWQKSILDSIERQKFVLASYNVGLGHIIDAKQLAIKYGSDSTLWDNHVAEYILFKSDPKYYRDSVVKYGYCRGSEPYKYVNHIMEGYNHYKNLIPK